MAAYRSYRWAIIILFLFLVVIVVAISHREKTMVERFDTVSIGNLAQRIDNLHIVRLKGEDIEWDMKARDAVIYNDEEDATVHGIEITYRTGKGTPVKLSGEKGRYNINKNAFSMERQEKDVEISIGKGLVIKTGNIEWLEDKREVHSSGRVYVKGKKFVLEGEDLTARIDSGTYEINKNIQATIWE